MQVNYFHCLVSGMTAPLFTEKFHRLKDFFQQNLTFGHLYLLKNEIKEDHSKCSEVDNIKFNLHQQHSFTDQ